VITAAKLRTRTVKDLAAMAKREGVAGWHSMRKEELIKALLKRVQEAAKRAGHNGGCRRNGKAPAGVPARAGDGRFQSQHQPTKQDRERLRQIRAKLARVKDLAHKAAAEERTPDTDRLVLIVRDPYWLHAYWELTPQSVERAEVAMGQHWHGAKPILRLYEASRDGTTALAKTAVRDIVIHGGVSNWYVDVDEPPRSFQMEIGYLSAAGKFFCLARSNVVDTGAAKKANGVDGNWVGVAEDFDRIYAMSGGYKDDAEHSELKEVFEAQLRRPMGSPLSTRFGMGAESIGHERPRFAFEIAAEMVVFGATEPGSHVTLRGAPIRVREDGTFSLRFALPNRRQVLPLVASSGDGAQQRTVVLAVERNTKVMEPVAVDSDE